MALILAGYLGASRIVCHGVDMLGTLDWDGVKAGERRTDERWEHEAGIWRRVCEWLDQSCEVTRHEYV
jgi:hypothetical protein